MKKYLVAALSLIMVFCLTACGGGNESNGSESSGVSNRFGQEEPDEISMEDALDDRMNKPAKDVLALLEKEGYTVTVLHENTKMDFKEQVEYDIAHEGEELSNNWVMVSYEKLNEKKKTVTILVNTEENIAEAAAQKAAETSLQAKLDAITAWDAVVAYGEAEYPHGFKAHYIKGMLAQTAEDENTWFLKATCTIKDASGAKQESVVEARVTGTTDSPQVTHFSVY